MGPTSPALGDGQSRSPRISRSSQRLVDKDLGDRKWFESLALILVRRPRATRGLDHIESGCVPFLLI